MHSNFYKGSIMIASLAFWKATEVIDDCFTAEGKVRQSSLAVESLSYHIMDNSLGQKT